jgi:D-3-phosphoglycerate dehydrogenase
MSIIAITDHFLKPANEIEVLGNLVGMGIGKDTEVLLVWHKTIDKEFIKSIPNLRGVQRYGVGYDTVDVKYLKSRGIIFCNNPDYGVDEVADTAVSMILSIARGVYNYNYASKSYFDSWQENIIPSIKRNSETVIGIIGAGRIGGNVLMKCNSLKFQTVFYDPYKERGYEKLLNGKRVNSLHELLAVADVVSVHTPLNEETRGMINEDFISNMKNGASLVNTARGGLFSNLDLLYIALKNEKLFSLAIDVLEEEPPKSCLLIDAWRDVNNPLQGRLIINPHSSYYSQSSFKELRLNAAKNALRIYQGKIPFNIIEE